MLGMDGGVLKIISQLEDRQAKEGVQVSRGNIFLTRRGHVGRAGDEWRLQGEAGKVLECPGWFRNQQ